MNETQRPAPVAAPARPSFAAMRHPGFRAQFVTFMVAMMADNIEHVISYWVMFHKFHSPALQGFAVVSHWLPFLLFSVAAGALAERFDPRRVIQCGMAMFIVASLGWGVAFLTDGLQVWQAMVLLVIHGCAGVLWAAPGQMLTYDIVGPTDLQSAVRLSATARYIGILAGPGVGGLILLTCGPAIGILVNTLFYLPLVLWLVSAPYGPRFRKGEPPPQRAVRGLADIVQTARAISGLPVILMMTVLGGCYAFFVGNAYQAQMPGFAADLGHGDPGGFAYSLLLAADAGGALTAGVILESGAFLRASPRTAIVLAMTWAAALTGFALSPFYAVAVGLLFAAGFFELSFNSMAQALVQIKAPLALRGRVLGFYNMANLGLRTFSGITVGIIGSRIGVHASLAVFATLMLAVAGTLLVLWSRLAPETGKMP